MADPRLVLIETAPALPGLLPVQAMDALRSVERVLARDPERHPSAPHLAMVGIALEAATPATPSQIRGLDLLAAGGAAGDVRLARGLVEAAADGDVAYVMTPDETGFERTIAMEAAKVGGLEVEFVFLVGAPRGLELLRLVETMAALRDPESGCPWDLQQDHRTLSRYLLEETYELLEAIDSGDDDHLAEELGDVLLQVVFHAQVARDREAFGIDDVARGIADKLVRRHPHVFGDGDASTPEEVQANWDQLKAAEKSDRDGPFDGVPTALPALMLAEELQRKAARTGFDWSAVEEPAGKVREELDEVLAADDADREAEVGDLLLAVVGLARKLGIEPEHALRRAAADFRTRFEAVVSRAKARDLELAAIDVSTWRSLWDEVKDAGF